MCIINVNFDLTAIAVVAVLSYFAYRHGYVYVRDKCIAMAHYPKISVKHTVREIKN